MNSQLQCVEIQPSLARDDQLTIQHVALRKPRAQRVEHVGEVAVERFLVAALYEDFLAVAKDQNAEAIPLGLEDPVAGGGDVIDPLGEHGKNGRIYGKVHSRALVNQATILWQAAGSNRIPGYELAIHRARFLISARQEVGLHLPVRSL